MKHSNESSSNNSNNSDNSDNSDHSAKYQTVAIDYMRDVFRPKLFVKAGSSTNSQKRTLYTSVYGGLEGRFTENVHSATRDQAQESRRGNVIVDDVEEEEARAYAERMREVERKFEGQSNEKEEKEGELTNSPLARNTINSSPSSAIPVQFQSTQCACRECSPVVLESGDLHCDLCNITLVNDTWIAHMQSIGHQWKRSKGQHQYINPYMNPSSQAYRVMESMGWREGEGLGYEGNGRLEPIPTRLKDNHLGIGAEDDHMPLRITHTPHNDDADPHEPPEVAKERERLIKKYGLKRLKRIIKRYHEKKRMAEQRRKEEWLRDEFRL